MITEIIQNFPCEEKMNIICVTKSYVSILYLIFILYFLLCNLSQFHLLFIADYDFEWNDLFR